MPYSIWRSAAVSRALLFWAVKKDQGLAFIAPMFWLHFPAILKGWFERVFAYGDAYGLTSEGWRGEVKGRVPLLQPEKALVINTTLFREEDYKAQLEKPMTRIIDDWGKRRRSNLPSVRPPMKCTVKRNI